MSQREWLWGLWIHFQKGHSVIQNLPPSLPLASSSEGKREVMIATCNFWNALTESAKQNSGGSDCFLSPPGHSDQHPRLRPSFLRNRLFPFLSF